MPAVILLLLSLAFPMMVAGADEPEVIEGCYPLTLKDIANFKVPRFEEYAVTIAFTGQLATPDVKSQARARRFRTMIRREAAQGPNFAGHYTIVWWGCGTACIEFAIVDAKSGRVFFSSGLSYIDGTFVGIHTSEPEPELTTLRYRLDSSLLIVIGAPEERETRAGVTYYEWNGKHLNKLRFIRSDKKICREGRDVVEK